MDNVLYEYLLQNKKKERIPRPQRDDVSGRRPHFRGVNSSFRSPVVMFQNDRAGPSDGAGDVPGALSPRQPGWIDQALTEMEKATPAKQLLVGGISGWVSGYVCGKVGRIAAVAVGGSIILLQIAHYQGFIQINWNRLERRLEDTRRHLNEQTFDNLPFVVEYLREFARRHFLLTGSFFAGFLVGMTT